MDPKSFSANAEMSMHELLFLILPARKNILELRNNRTLKLKFSHIPLDEVWNCIEEVYKRISKVAIEILLLFCTTVHNCVNKVSHLFLIKNVLERR